MKDQEAYSANRDKYLRCVYELGLVIPADSVQHLFALNAAVAGMVEDSTEIPPEKRTRPVSKSEVAKIVCPRSNVKASLRALNDAIVAGDFRCQRMNRSRHWFHLDDFAPEHQEKLRE